MKITNNKKNDSRNSLGVHITPSCRSLRVLFALVTATMLLVPWSGSAVVITNEYWIGPSTNGQNLGTIQDPFDGSTQSKFDAVMFMLSSNVNSTIHILPGIYQTKGNYINGGYVVVSGQRIMGSGIDVTVLRLVTNVADTVSVIGSTSGVNIEVADLTVDCNSQAGAFTLHGVAIGGTRCAIRRVKCINAVANSPNGYECFPLSISGSCCGINQNSEGNIIEECEVSQFQGSGPCSAIALNSNSATNWITGTIRNNRVFLSPASAFQIYAQQFAYNVGAGQNVLVEGNYSEGGLRGYYNDSGPYTNVVVSHNFFKNCYDGIYFGPITSVDNVSFIFNTIELGSFTNQTGITLWERNTTNATFGNIAILGNSIRFADGISGNNGYALSFQAISGCTVANNKFQNTLNYNFVSTTNLVANNNFDFNGNFVTNSLNQVAPPNGWTRRTVTNNNTLVYSDYYIGVSPNSTTTVTNTLPAASGHNGKIFVVGDEAGFAATKNIYIVPASPDKINGSTSPVKITTAYGSLTLVANGTNWFAH